MKGKAAISRAIVKEAADKTLETSKAFTVNNSLIETLDSTLEFPSLRALAARYPDTPEGSRPVGIAKVAIYRDARYSVVNGVYCHTAAIRGEYRGLYEKHRLLYPLEEFK